MKRKLPLRSVCAAALAAVCATGTFAETFVIPASQHDTYMRANGSEKHYSRTLIRAGSIDSQDFVALFPFALPAIPDGEFILSATIQFHLTQVVSTPRSADAYILPYRPTTELTSEDFYIGEFGADPDATALQQGVLSMDSPLGQNSIGFDARDLLVEHINLQYDQGAQPGEYIVLRLSPSSAGSSGNHYLNISSGNNEVGESRPVLIIETFDGNYAPEVAQTGLQAVEVGQQIQFTVSASDLNAGDTLTLGSSDLPGFATLVDNGDGTATITAAPVSGNAGLYTFTITASDGAKEGAGEVTVVVTDANASGNVPTFDSLDPLAIDQGAVVTIDINVSDTDSQSVTLTAVSLPPFATFVDNGDLTGTLTLNTWYSDAPGEYDIYVVAEDEASNTGVLAFKLTLQEVDFPPGYYVDPINGDMGNDGSPESPWSTLQAVMSAANFQPGDVIYLRDGYHGQVTLNSANDDYIYIRAAEGHTPMLSRLSFGNSSSKWHVSGLSISREHAPEFSKATNVTLNGTENILSDSLIYTVADISGWAAEDWVANSCHGVEVGGSHNTVEGCTILNIDMGITSGTSTTFHTFRNNHIQYFSGDGFRLLGNDHVVEGNFIADNYAVDSNHDDGIQGWSVADGLPGTGTGVTARMTIRNNTIIETTDPDRPLQGPLQGIGLFDGMFEEWVIENNVIVVNMWHGISIYGAHNCRIVNNTVLDQNMFERPGPTWITIEPHKRWTNETDLEKKNYLRGNGNIVHNNITTAFGPSLTSHPYADVKNNLIINEVQFDKYFVGYPFDMRLRATSPAIDAGLADEATETDILGVSRTVGGAPDVGAYEWSGKWNGWDVEEGWVNTGAFLGQMYIGFEPWLYIEGSGSWFYLNDALMSDVGAWVYTSALVRVGDGATNSNTWAGYPLDSGWAITPIGAIYLHDESWVFINAMGSWAYIPTGAVGEAGAWIFATNGQVQP